MDAAELAAMAPEALVRLKRAVSYVDDDRHPSGLSMNPGGTSISLPGLKTASVARKLVAHDLSALDDLVRLLVLGEDFLIRPARLEEESERRFISDSWRKSYSMPWSDFAASPSLDDYMRSQSTVIDVLLQTGAVLVACAPDDADQIIGWICVRPPAVCHYLFVKHFSRGLGVGRALFEQAFGPPIPERVYATHLHTVTFETKLVSRRDRDGRLDRARPVPVWRAFGCRLHFSPFLVFA